MKRQTLFFKQIYSIILQSQEPLWIPSALVETPDFRPTIVCDTRFSSTSSLKMLIRKRKCFQKVQEFPLPILVAVDIPWHFSTFISNFLLG